MSEANKVVGRKSKVGTHGSCVRATKPQHINESAILFRRFIFRLGFRSGFFQVARAEASLLDYAESREKT